MIQIKKWGSRKIQNSLPLMNTSKTHLHEEQFSLKTNETGRKTLIRLKVYERSMRSWIEREKKQSGCDLCSRERTGKRSSYKGAEILPEEGSFKPHIGHPDPWV